MGTGTIIKTLVGVAAEFFLKKKDPMAKADKKASKMVEEYKKVKDSLEKQEKKLQETADNLEKKATEIKNQADSKTVQKDRADKMSGKIQEFFEIV